MDMQKKKKRYFGSTQASLVSWFVADTSACMVDLSLFLLQSFWAVVKYALFGLACSVGRVCLCAAVIWVSDLQFSTGVGPQM
ncbi:hypothetical protein Nepgr_030868 [Nepenthes gracilis]|uniref:Uncharacterized protein n=1 Tax=Nepenthes gracilis TaxID=150966 RepID=A0AAD3Y680_NEPGR|nr:hypothetical protein Nepgr_030868 [Nepenthes gracilis]